MVKDTFHCVLYTEIWLLYLGHPFSGFSIFFSIFFTIVNISKVIHRYFINSLWKQPPYGAMDSGFSNLPRNRARTQESNYQPWESWTNALPSEAQFPPILNTQTL